MSRIVELTALIRNLYAKEWTPSNEAQLARKIEEKGGAKFVEHNDSALSELAQVGKSSSAKVRLLSPYVPIMHPVNTLSRVVLWGN